MTEAARCAATFLYMVPDNAEMTNNVNYYKHDQQVQDQWFKPRPEVINYVNRYFRCQSVRNEEL